MTGKRICAGFRLVVLGGFGHSNLEEGALADIIQITRMNEGFFRECGLFLHSGKFLLLFGEGLTGFSKRLCLFVGLCSQAVQTLLLPLNFELVVAPTSVNFGKIGRAHV